MARAARRRHASAGEEPLCDPVLERVRGYDGEPPLVLQETLRGGKAVGELGQLLVEKEPERLEGSCRRVLGLVAFAAENLGDEFGKLAGRGDRPLCAPRHDGLGDGAGPTLL